MTDTLGATLDEFSPMGPTFTGFENDVTPTLPLPPDPKQSLDDRSKPVIHQRRSGSPFAFELSPKNPPPPSPLIKDSRYYDPRDTPTGPPPAKRPA